MTPYEAPEIPEMPPPDWLEPVEPLASIPLLLSSAWEIVILFLILVWIHLSRNVPQKWDEDPAAGG